MRIAQVRQSPSAIIGGLQGRFRLLATQHGLAVTAVTSCVTLSCYLHFPSCNSASQPYILSISLLRHAQRRAYLRYVMQPRPSVRSYTRLVPPSPQQTKLLSARGEARYSWPGSTSQCGLLPTTHASFTAFRASFPVSDVAADQRQMKQLPRVMPQLCAQCLHF